MRFLLLLCATALLSPAAKADKFWLSDPKSNTAQGSQADMIHGVLLGEDDHNYQLRVVGGELLLAKKRVFKIEKDDLTIDDIVALEKKDRERLAKTAEARAMQREAELSRRQARAAEATARRNATETVLQPVVEIELPTFDPAIGTFAVNDATSYRQRLRDLQVAWVLTKDRRFIKLIRQTRRMKYTNLW